MPTLKRLAKNNLAFRIWLMPPVPLPSPRLQLLALRHQINSAQVEEGALNCAGVGAEDETMRAGG